MGMPEGIGIIDTMIGFPFTDKVSVQVGSPPE
jgi:hypothetical protein